MTPTTKPSAPELAMQLGAVAGSSFRALSSDIAPGCVVRFTCVVEAQRHQLWSMLTGSTPPQRGQMYMFGQDFFAASEHERLALCRRVGVVPYDGGLISNLKAWENIVLPVSYHRGTSVAARR